MLFTVSVVTQRVSSVDVQFGANVDQLTLMVSRKLNVGNLLEAGGYKNLPDGVEASCALAAERNVAQRSVMCVVKSRRLRDKGSGIMLVELTILVAQARNTWHVERGTGCSKGCEVSRNYY